MLRYEDVKFASICHMPHYDFLVLLYVINQYWKAQWQELTGKWLKKYYQKYLYQNLAKNLEEFERLIVRNKYFINYLYN